MSLHIKKQKAREEASRLELELAQKARLSRHSSGYKYIRYGVRRSFLVFWVPYEVGRPRL